MNLIMNIKSIEIIQKYEHYEKVINFNTSSIRFIHECFCPERPPAPPHPSKVKWLILKCRSLQKIQYREKAYS
jgi:hypothetical protein